MRDIKAEAVEHLRTQYDAGIYAEPVLEWLIESAVFKPMSSGYYYDTRYFTIDIETIARIIEQVKG
jgi:hypothetical protein